MNTLQTRDAAAAFARLREAMARGSSCDRLPDMLELSGFCDSQDWLGELGKQWSGFDNIGIYAEELADAVHMHHQDIYPITAMMDAQELEAFHKLPEVLTVYRGCYAVNKWGFSWSLDRAVAERFPFLHRYSNEGRPLLVRATLQKNRVAALKLDRNEAEIVTFARPKCISISTARMSAVQPLEVSA